MWNNKFSDDLRQVLINGNQIARRHGQHQVGTHHLVLSMLNNLERLPFLEYIFQSYDKQTLDDVRRRLQQLDENHGISATGIITNDSNVALTGQAARALKQAQLVSMNMDEDEVCPAHLLIAIMKNRMDPTTQILMKNEIIPGRVENRYKELLNSIENEDEDEDAHPDHDDEVPGFFNEAGDDDDDDSEEPRRMRREQASKRKKDKTPVLDNFGRDLTRLAAEGKLDPVVGRQKEIERVSQILSRRKKNNPILIGEPGVGKSAIVEGLALRIVQKKVSRVLFDKRIVALDLASLVAGTKYRGQFEERMKALLKELQNNPDVIIFIDEIHTLVGAGGAQGSLDASNMFKPALARGEIQTIGATTLDEYRQYIEKDGALARRFQMVMVNPTTVDETVQILHNIKDRYEAHHNVIYTDDAIEAAVKLTNRYMTDRYLPDKAIDAMDEAGARVHLQNIVVPEYMQALEKNLEEIREQKKQAVRSQDFEKAAKLRDQETRITNQLKIAQRRWEEDMKRHPETVSEENVADVVSMMTGIPVNRIAEAESNKLRKLPSIIKSQVIGQDEAVDKVVKAIQRNRLGLKDPNKPIGSFIFLGQTGVGKTQLAKVLAKELFDSEDALIRLDMSEYMEKFSVSRLIGAPPGYVGYEEGGQLTEKVRRKPYSVVLFDEIEKAHPDVFNILLQILDEGAITDSIGRRIDFRNTVVILTSNVGARQLKDFGEGVGFGTAARQAQSSAHARSIIEKALKKTFAPEFLNRIDDIIIFNPLNKEHIEKIIDIELAKLYKRVEENGYKLEITPAAKAFIAEKGYDKQYGARPLKRAIQKYVEDLLAEEILEQHLHEGDRVILDFKQGDEKPTVRVVQEPTDSSAQTEEN